MTRCIAIVLPSYDTRYMRFLLTLLTLAALALLSGPAAAIESPEVSIQIAQSDGMSLSQAIESVRRSTGGKVVSAETKVQGGREVHHIKVLTKDGKVKTHKVNGRRL